METIQEAIHKLQQAPTGVMALGDEAGACIGVLLTPQAYEASVEGVVRAEALGIPQKRDSRGQRKARARKREQAQKRLETEQRRARHLQSEMNRKRKLQRKIAGPRWTTTPYPTTGTTSVPVRFSS